MSVYQFEDYKEYFNNWVESLPKQGHGEYRRVSMALNVSTTMVSQVFKGDKELSLELACDLCEYLNLNEDETDYFLLLVEHRRAGSMKLQKRLQKQIKERKDKAQKLENRLKKETELSDQQKAIFYSSWIYSGVRILASCDDFNDAVTISQRLNLPRNQVQKILDFLLTNGLLVQKKGELQLGATKTFIGSSDLLTVKHHQNWRLQGFNRMVQDDSKNLFYSGPMSLSHDVAELIRQELSNLLDKVYKVVPPSKSETTRCLNIDWFDF
ncbi:TIGR02147 family protein [Bdellovibrio sp. HCB337]|uniref:TIGR02147 family protein n=1 Tax=Bdellovibrio sp. HCB337 TaxID=3394358 RepID=UPI0039A45BC4